ncbi:MAG: hypothetical protein J6Z13_01250 [Clostridia bacterium]|nr:hypothetical protein [Clostridia bacterium]
MKRALISICLLILAALLLASCGKSDVPEGMTLASDPDLDGFVFYVPKGYTIGRSAGVLTAFVSELDPTSMTATIVAPEEESLAAYWDANRAALDAIADTGTTVAFESENAECPVGKEELPGRAWVYSFTRGGVNYKVMQILVMRGDSPSEGVAILTYTGKVDATVTGTVGYTDHIEDFELSVANFSFREVTETPEAKEKITEGAPEGMQLASDPKIAYYSLYLPLDWNADMRTGISSGYTQDGAGVSAASFYPEGFSTVQEYFASQKEQYELRYKDVTVIGEEPEQIKVDGCDAFRYECRVTRRGDGRVVRFSVVYVLLRTGLHRGLYTVTLSAVGENADAADAVFAAHTDEFARVLSEFRFK